jgi:PAS domain S-box-containing protein
MSGAAIMKSARAIMTPNPKHIQSGERLLDTISLFFQNNIHFAPVITPTGEILGLLSEVSLVKAALRHYLDPGKNEKVYAHRDLLEPVVYVQDNESIDDVVKAIMKSPSRRVLVRDFKDALCGIISPKDIIRFLSGEQHQMIQINDHLKKYEEKTKTLSIRVQTLQDLVHIYKEAFDNSPLMMHSLDGRGNIVMANRKIHEALGYEPGELIGKGIQQLYPHTMHDLAIDGLEKIKRIGFHNSTTTQMIKKDGHTLNVDIVSSALKNSEGTFLATISISRSLESSKGVVEALENYSNS